MVVAELALTLDPQDAFMRPVMLRTGWWEPEVKEPIERLLQPGWSFLDIGAHIGYFTLIASKITSDLTAIEPDPRIYDLLRSNIYDNNLPVVALRCALWDSVGHLPFQSAYDGNTGKGYVGEGTGTAQTTTLDCVGTFDMIKCDAEGAEYRIFSAAPRTLSAAQVIIFEYSPLDLQRTSGIEGPELLTLLREAGFTLYMMTPEKTTAVPHTPALHGDQYVNLVATRTPLEV